MLVEHSVHIAAPIRVVFDGLNDATRLPLWMEGLQKTEFPPTFDSAAPLGGSYRQHMVQFGYALMYTVTITGFVPPSGFSLNLVARYFTLDIDYTLQALTENSTHLHCATQISRTDWSIRLLQQMIADKMLAVLQRQMESFKHMIEETG